MTVTGPNNFALERSYALDVRPATQILTRRSVRQLAKGETLTLSKDLFADFVPGTGRVGLSVAISTSLDAATLLNALDRYPFGCSEQIASRAMAMLYVNELAQQARLAPDSETDQRIKDAIPRLLARQDSNGSFGMWSVGGNDPWLDSYVTDFLTRARERGFEVPATAYTLAIDRLRNYVATAPEANKDGGRELAYALYVLARNGAAPVGDLRYLADVRLSDVATPIAKAQIAAALAMVGDKERAENVYLAALNAISPQPKLDLGRTDFGSALRDAAALVTLASEARAPQKTIDDAVLRIDAARSLSASTSTQEDAWLVLAARALTKQLNAISLAVNGESRQGALYRSLRPDDLASPVAVANQGEGNVQAVISVSGAPLTPEPAAAEGFKIERSYHTLDGDAADPSKARQNQRFVVVLKMTEPQPQFGRVIVADYLPAGFEIDNPRLVSSGETGTLAWISDAVEPVNTEFRDDRFTAAFDRKQEFVACVQHCLCRAGGLARTICVAAGEGRGHVPARPLWPHSDRHHRDCAKMKRWRPVLAIAFGCAAAVLACAIWVHSLGPVPLGKNLDYSHVVLDRQGRLLRAYATSEGRWRLPVSERDVDPRFLKLLFAYEDKRFSDHPGVDASRFGTCCGSIHVPGPYRLGRLDDQHAGGASSRAARAAQSGRQIAPDRARARTRTRARQRRGPCALSDACALWRKSRGRSRGVARLFRQGAAQAVVGRGGATGCLAAIA